MKSQTNNAVSDPDSLPKIGNGTVDTEADILVILNPVSGRNDADETLETIGSYLEGEGIRHEIRQTTGEGDALEWARTARGFDRIIVGGGDGTVMEALSGVMKNEKPIPLAQLPLGTGNLLARALAMPLDLEEALEVAAKEGVAVPMDVGYLPGFDRYFALVAGSGWDAKLIEEADREMKNKLGFFAYVVSGIKALFDLQKSRVTITIDEKRLNFRAHTVMVINVGEIHGSGIALGPNVSPHDGKLDLAIASMEGITGLFRLLFQILTRKFDGSPELRFFHATQIRIEADPPLKLQIDGEAIGETPYDVRVVPSGVRLVVPRQYAKDKKVEFTEFSPTAR